MSSGLNLLDITLDAAPWKSPPTSPVRSFVGDLKDSPLPRTPGTYESSRFVDWEPGMLADQREAALELGDLPSLPDFEAELARSPMARRLAIPKGGLVVSAVEWGDELGGVEVVAEAPQEMMDVKQLAEAYEQSLLAREQAAEESASG
eukprot:TRINITY_DN2617_c0_g1_i2.p2 TRINITY_DN2617_c0_g1~~TRINITY_DN2617_c0_g1_i2.p2  ORF type:complete len:148 (+),score=30.09 TRINITY_DN2617_c0_g1_i2:47-490(+)